ncbi:ATP-binding cassette domain-containing protein [Microbacterium sp. NPDC055455]
MPDGQLLEFSDVTKRFGAVTAVSGLTAQVEPGRVTGFLGPNGAGKTTTLRILLGLVRATGGRATIGGRRYADLDRPLHAVGAVLEASSFHPGRTAAAHLTIYAQAAGIARGRVDEVLGLVGLSDAAGRKVGGYSLGMRQRLGLAYALLGDPGTLVLDEPANGLDPEGIRWMRGFLRQLAAEGRTVLVSSHLLAEVQQTVDALLIIARGRLVFQGSVDELADTAEHATVVDAPDREALTAALRSAGVPFEVLRSGLTVRGQDTVAIGAIAAASGIALSALHRRGPALEEVFLDLVNGARVHTGASVAAVAAVAAAQPEAAEPEPGRPEAAEPEPDQPEATEPEAEQPEAAEPVSGQLEAEQPEAEQPEADQPEAEQPDAEQPDAEQPDAEQPDAEQPEAPRPEASTAAYAVAGTGVIDIVPATGADAPEDDPWAPVDADPDVEAIAAVDDELTAPEPPDADDRPWERFVKTESDLEADAFFAAFDDSDGAAEPAPAGEGGPEPLPDDTAGPGDDGEDAASVTSPDAADDDGSRHDEGDER